MLQFVDSYSAAAATSQSDASNSRMTVSIDTQADTICEDGMRPGDFIWALAARLTASTFVGAAVVCARAARNQAGSHSDVNARARNTCTRRDASQPARWTDGQADELTIITGVRSGVLEIDRPRMNTQCNVPHAVSGLLPENTSPPPIPLPPSRSSLPSSPLIPLPPAPAPAPSAFSSYEYSSAS